MTTKPVESLRERQKRMARESILQAAADEIAERGLNDFSLQAVAARAGLSIRTLYNYFEGRDQLFVALGEWSNELTARSGAWVRVENLDGLPDAVPRVWRTWDDQENIYRALLRIDAAESTEAASRLRAERRDRTEQIMAAVSERRPDLPAEEIEEIATFVHAVLGPVVWERMRLLSGLTTERSGPVTTWALQLIVEALDRGDSPRSRSGHSVE